MEKNLAAFLAVAREQTLTAACETLGVTQPSATKRIANLEADFGVPLFARDRRGMTLTQAGRMLFTHAERIESEYRFSRERIGGMAAAGLSRLRVGAGPLFHLSCAASLFKRLKTTFPDLRLELVTDTRHHARAALISGDLDVYLGVLDGVEAQDGLVSYPVVDVEHGIVLRQDHPLAGPGPVDLRHLANHPWVIFGFDPLTEARLGELLGATAGGAEIIDIRTTSFATGLELVKEGPFVMSAPLPLTGRVRGAGLTICPTVQGMPKRSAGVHLRHSTAAYGVMEATLRFFETFSFEASPFEDSESVSRDT